MPADAGSRGAGPANEAFRARELARARARALPLSSRDWARRSDDDDGGITAAPDAAGTPAGSGGRRRPVLAIQAAIGLALAAGLIVALATTQGTASRASGLRTAVTVTPRTALAPAPTALAPAPTASASAPTAPSAPAGPPATVTLGDLTVARTIALGAPALGLAVDASGTVWVSLPDGGVLAVPAAGGAPTPHGLPGTPGPLATTTSGVWAGLPSLHEVVRLAGGRVQTTAVLASSPTAIAPAVPADGSVWVADASGALTHLGAGHEGPARPFAHLTVAPGPAGLALGEPDWLWVLDGDLQRIGPSGHGATRITTGAGAEALTLNAGVWVGHADGSVTRIDPRAGHDDIAAVLHIPAGVSALAARDGAPFVWAISGAAHSLYEISAARAHVIGSVRFSSAPTGVSVTHLGVWVTTAAGQLVRVER